MVTKRNMKAKNILFINTEMMPYTAETELSTRGRALPQKMLELGHEVRTFIPKWTGINDRRHMIHEVYRLSGQNILVGKTEHIAILKVASIPSARIQVYFIENDDLLNVNPTTINPKTRKQYTNLGEKAAFFIRGVMDTVKNLNWTPDVIHCTGWVAALAPLYLKKAYSADKHFKNSKIVCSVTPEAFTTPLGKNFFTSLPYRDIIVDDVSSICTDKCSHDDLMKIAIKFSDGVIFEKNASTVGLRAFAKKIGIPTLKAQDKNTYVEAYNDFYEKICNA